MRNKASITEYLHYLAVKYDIDCESLFKGLVEARENHETRCGRLSIQCRQKTRDNDAFLITNGLKVVAQFPVPKYFLNQPGSVEELKCAHLFKRVSKPYVQGSPNKIRDLRCGMKRINLKARVIEVPKANMVFTRFGENARVAHALIADETGTIKLCLWNEKINAVSADSIVQIENASVTKFRGENQLRLGKNGRLNVLTTPTLI